MLLIRVDRRYSSPEAALRYRAKQLRASEYIEVEEADFAMSDSVESDSQIPSRLSRKFPKYQLKSNSETCFGVLQRYMNVDYSVESLAVLDRRVLAQTPEEFRRRISVRKDQSSPSMWSFFMGPGSYFAEVIIRNLGGKWKYPSRILVFFCLWAGYINPAYRHWYVVVGKQKVPVFEIMKRRLEMGEKEVSLTQVYHEIANGTFKLKKNP